MIYIEPDEQILLRVRKHWLIIVKETLFLIGVILFPAFFYIFLRISTIPDWVVVQGNQLYLWLFFDALWLLVCWTMFFIVWTDYYLDVLVVTNKRIFDVEQKGLFNRESSAFRLDRIQDITVEVKGILATFLNYGHISLETAGDAQPFVASYIPNPYEVKRLISAEHDKAIEKSRRVKIENSAEDAQQQNTTFG